MIADNTGNTHDAGDTDDADDSKRYTNQAVYVDATPTVSVGEVSDPCAVDGLPLVIIEDDSGDGLDGGPFRVTMSVPAARALVECLIAAIEELEEEHPELLDENDEFELVVEGEDEDEDDGDDDDLDDN